jgi:sporulation protein YlmC with PRC-barrel domain
MIDNNVIRDIMGATVYDASGEKIGKVGQVYLDSDSGRPVWASVNTGLFGTSENFVPLNDANWDGENLRVGYDKSFVTDAPRIDVDGALSTENQDELYRYYTLENTSQYRDDRDRSEWTDDRDRTEWTDDGDRSQWTDDSRSGRDTSDLDTDDAMNRQDDESSRGTRTAEAGRVRLRRYTVTEEQTITVPVTREEVRVEWVPDSEANVDDDRDDRRDNPDVR